MPTPPERKILDLSSCCQAKLLFVERGQNVGKTVCSGCMQIQEEPVQSHPQETREEEWWEENPKYMAIVAGKSSCKVYNIPAIIQEAERRERRVILKELRKISYPLAELGQYNSKEQLVAGITEYIRLEVRLLHELNTPSTP